MPAVGWQLQPAPAPLFGLWLSNAMNEAQPVLSAWRTPYIAALSVACSGLAVAGARGAKLPLSIPPEESLQIVRGCASAANSLYPLSVEAGWQGSAVSDAADTL
mmetsp:Transcript_7231/g.20386  ORF Transcript_7231/g.20386 Transcript_7231/m.20386 type:complete len:104 (-) Transcript_7231:196-507(-)